MDSGSVNTKKCGFCGVDIPADATRCSYCGSLLDVKVDHNAFNPRDQETSSQEREFPAVENSEKIGGDAAAKQVRPDIKPAYEAKPASNVVNAYRHEYKIPSYGENDRKPLSNGLKVFLTILFTVIPGLGQLAGIITAIVFMNADDDADRKSFGVALLVASIIIFVLSCIGCFVFALVFSLNQSSILNGF